ncbi:hypothetical protein [Azospirillum argentinense]|uniref:hypothetical protein n=1 Tax=Azospirillum argentinense TaxID=2970906 RepID=UPI0032DF6C05
MPDIDDIWDDEEDRRGYVRPEQSAARDDGMGTMDEALSKLLTAYNNWTPYQQPLMAPAAEHRKREAMGREAQVRLVQAAALVGWHLKNADHPATPAA